MQDSTSSVQEMSKEVEREPIRSKQSSDVAIIGQYKEKKQYQKQTKPDIGTSFYQHWKESKTENRPNFEHVESKYVGEKNRSSQHEKDISSSTFYILLENIWAKKEQKTYSGYSSSGQKHLSRGEILIRNMTTVVDNTKGTLKLHPYDKGTYYCDCPVANIEPLNDEEAKLLLPFKSNDERYKIYKNNLLDNGRRMTVGCNVFVKVKTVGGSIVELRGVIRYKGPLPGEDGTMFGVELLVSSFVFRSYCIIDK